MVHYDKAPAVFTESLQGRGPSGSLAHSPDSARSCPAASLRSTGDAQVPSHRRARGKHPSPAQADTGVGCGEWQPMGSCQVSLSPWMGSWVTAVLSGKGQVALEAQFSQELGKERLRRGGPVPTASLQGVHGETRGDALRMQARLRAEDGRKAVCLLLSGGHSAVPEGPQVFHPTSQRVNLSRSSWCTSQSCQNQNQE